MQFYSNAQMQFCSNAQMQFCSNAQMQFCSNAQMQFFSNAQMQFYANAQMQFYANAQMQFCVKILRGLFFVRNRYFCKKKSCESWVEKPVRADMSVAKRSKIAISERRRRDMLVK